MGSSVLVWHCSAHPRSSGISQTPVAFIDPASSSSILRSSAIMNKPLRKACLIPLLIFQTPPDLTTASMVRLRGDDHELPDLNIALEPEPPIPAWQPAGGISSPSTQERWVASPPDREVAFPSSHPNLAAPQSSAAAREILYPFTQTSWADTSRGTNVETVTQESTQRPGSNALKRTRVSKPLTSTQSSETSTDGGILENNRPPRKLQKLIPSLEIHSIIDEHDQTGEASAVIRPSLNVHHWDMVRVHEQEGQRDENGQPASQPSEKLEMFFKLLLFEHSDGFYWLPPEKLQHTTASYNFLKEEWAEGTLGNRWTQIRPKIAADILLELADQKLDLDSHPIFKELMSSTPSTTVKKKGQLDEFRVGPRMINSISTYVSKVTKIATFLIILRSSILNQHAPGQLNEAMLNGILTFIWGFWEELECMDEKLIDSHPSWAKINSKILRFQVPKASYLTSFIYSKIKFYEVATRIAESWEEKHLTNKVYQHIKKHQRSLIRISGDILFHSNPKIVDRYTKENSHQNNLKNKNP
ncbi:hypothetical protein VP01_2347g1 [Puccinia sorghi]|uniref:Uncharacterized protein n=1 Tax=Puccinia sorghi TaxID=27349 RepID=A0A0L6V797_9BASI|nr:hypothetical protein VP01_2347g1 [Puccinia sorghi]